MFVNARKKPSTVPIATARTVSCAASPRNARLYHSCSSSASTSSGGISRGLFRSISSGVTGGFWKSGMGGFLSAHLVDEQTALDGAVVKDPPALGFAAHGSRNRGRAGEKGGRVAVHAREGPSEV